MGVGERSVGSLQILAVAGLDAGGDLVDVAAGLAVAPLGGGSVAATSVGSCAGSGVSVLVPFVVFTPSLKAALKEVRVRVPATFTETCDVEPAATVEGTVMVSVGGFAPPLA